MLADTPHPPEPLPPETGNDAQLVSFVVRFVFERAPDEGGPGDARPAAGWHGLIRHVQSDAERYFTHWSDAVAFIGQFVTVEEPPRNA